MTDNKKAAPEGGGKGRWKDDDAWAVYRRNGFLRSYFGYRRNTRRDQGEGANYQYAS